MRNLKGIKKEIQGFTLIELLTVIAIIGILASIVLPNLTGAREKARDAKRITDVAQITLAAELYYNACRTYPAAPLVLTNGCTGVTLGSFLSNPIPTNPTGGSYDYGTDGSGFVVGATLETTGHASLSNDINGTHFTVNCDGQKYCKGKL